MSTLQKILLSVAITLSIFALVLVTNKPVQQIITGSVIQSGEYHSTTTRTATAGTALTSPTTLCSTAGTLGSVVITGAATGIMNFYNGTTTTSNSDYGTTTLASFPASTAAGTYTFDLNATQGLLYEVISGTVGTTTITYRCS